MGAISSTPIATGIPAGTLNPQPDGTVTLTIDETTHAVLSVQPDGSFQTRPAGTAGPYEKARQQAGWLIYCPEGKVTYWFAYSPDCPNT